MRLPIAFRDNQQISLADSTLVEHRGAIVDSLHIVRCRCRVIFQVLGWLGQIFVSLSMWTSMNRFSQDSSCDVNVNCAINVLKFRFGRFQKIVTRTNRSMWAANPRKVQSMIGIVKSHCLSNWRRFWKGMDRLTRDRSVLRCSRMTIGIWLELIRAHNLSNQNRYRRDFSVLVA